MTFKKTSAPAVPEPKGARIVYTRSCKVNEKLQKAGYVVKAMKQLTTLGAKEYELEGKTPLKVETLNEAIKESVKGHQRATQLITDLTVTKTDLELIYGESIEPTPEVKQMKKEMDEGYESRDAKSKKRNKHKAKRR